MLTQTELEKMTCQLPGCKHEGNEVLVLVGRCHPGKGVVVKYMRQRRSIEVTCRTCDRFIAEVAVAGGEIAVGKS